MTFNLSVAMDIIGMILRRSSTSSEQGQYDDNDVGGGGEGCMGDNDVRGGGGDAWVIMM